MLLFIPVLFVQTVVILAHFGRGLFPGSADPIYVFTSGHSEKVMTFLLDPAMLTLVPSSDKGTILPPGYEMASFAAVSLSPKMVYFVHEVDRFLGTQHDTGAVSMWSIDAPDGATSSKGPEFQHAKDFLTNGEGPVHVELDPINGLLHVANYAGSSFVVFRLGSDGVIKEEIYFEKYEFDPLVGESRALMKDKDQQEAPHPHQVRVFGDFIYVVDFGSDKIWNYKVVTEAGQTKRIEKADPEYNPLPQGFGPRHMAIAASVGKAFVLNELQPFISTFDLDLSTGALTFKEHFRTMSSPGSLAKNEYGAEIALHPSERFLYTSNRGTGAICAFSIVPWGLERIQVMPTSGNSPRHFRIMGDRIMLVAQEFENLLELYHIDVTTGHLGFIKSVASDNFPTYVGVL